MCTHSLSLSFSLSLFYSSLPLRLSVPPTPWQFFSLLCGLRPRAAGNSRILAHLCTRIQPVQYISSLVQLPADGEGQGRNAESELRRNVPSPPFSPAPPTSCSPPLLNPYFSLPYPPSYRAPQGGWIRIHSGFIHGNNRKRDSFAQRTSPSVSNALAFPPIEANLLSHLSSRVSGARRGEG